MSYEKYPDFGRIDQLRSDGRELLGKVIHLTVKRDGENVPIYMNANSEMVLIGSRNQKIADDNIRNGVVTTKEYPSIVELLLEEPTWTFFYEHMMPGRGPTKIEMARKNHSMVLIDIWDGTRFLHYNAVHQYAHKYKIPIVGLLDVVQPDSLDELFEIRDKWLKWCRVHHKEGFVGKDYRKQVFFKEKIDLPKKQKGFKKGKKGPTLPPMPEAKIIVAVERAIHECKENDEDYKSPKFAMVRIARHISAEAAEHHYAPPRNYFGYYKRYLDEHRGD